MLIMANISNVKNLVGQKVFVTLKENKQTFEGFLHSLIERRLSISLRHVTSVPSDGRSFEQLELCLKDIQDMCTLSEDQGNIDSAPDQTSATSDTHEENTCPSSNSYTSFFDEQFYEKLKLKAKEYIYIKENNTDLLEALKTIKSSNIIAVTGEGSDEGRFGLMGILGISTGNSVFLFDVINIGEKLFSALGSALKWVLETKSILKIVHNCRLLSDNLFHKYHVTLKNVYDTQVCYSIIFKYRTGSFPANALNLSALISSLFKLPEGLCREVTSFVEWRKRPLSSELLNLAAWRVTLLRPVRRALENAFYAPFDDLCDLYTRVVRDSDLLEARGSLERNTLLPKEMTEKHTSGL